MSARKLGEFKEKLVAKGVIGGTTVSVLHLVFDRSSGELDHLGLKGLRGWSGDPRMVSILREYRSIARRRKT